MHLYLVRHGEAAPGDEDGRRPLTSRGRADVSRLAEAAAGRGVTVDEIRHSGLLRARQTAEILAARLGPPGGLRIVVGLEPGDDPAIATAECELAPAPLLLVGHLPHLARLAARLTRGRAPAEMRPASMLCLEPADRGWEVAWQIDGATTR